MIAALMIAALVTIDPPASSPAPTHTRVLSTIAQAVVDEATRSSPTVTSMIASLEQTDVIVYVNTDILSFGGWTQLIGVSQTARFLEVTINVALDPDRRAEVLAHELQHVLEIARASDVRDDDGMNRLFGRIGWTEGRSTKGRARYETAAAIDIEGVVRQEVWKSRAAAAAARQKKREPIS